MQPIQVNVAINIGMSAELMGLLSAVLNRPAQPVAENTQPEAVNKQAEQPTPENRPAAPAPPAPEKPAEQPEQPKEYTEADVRAAMDRTRRRIEGENYKVETDSEGYKKWHVVLKNFFKSTAALLGSDRPSTLPDSESRRKFIAQCDAVYVKNGELVEDCPF